MFKTGQEAVKDTIKTDQEAMKAGQNWPRGCKSTSKTIVEVMKLILITHGSA